MKSFMSQKAYLVCMLLMSVFISILAGCGGGGGGTWTDPGSAGAGNPAVNPPVPPVPASARPTVTFISPLDAVTGVPVTTKIIRATFSKAMNQSTVNVNTFTVQAVGFPKVAGTISYNTANNSATFSPTGNLTADTLYTVTVSAVATDTSGNALVVPAVGLPKNPWTFRTAVAGAPVAGILDLMSYGVASAGGITNSGATKINGNVVLNPLDRCNNVVVGATDNFGLCGGAAPTNNLGDRVITQIHPDTTTADDIRAQLLVKWNSISPAGTAPAVPTVLGCGVIGSAGGGGAGIGCAGNSTLPAGIYIAAIDSIGVTGVLTLNGNATDVWIFQAPSSTVVTAVNSSIVLTGGARASNVWWFVGSSATLNDGTTFQGNILASASISMGTGATSCGRLLAGAEGFGAFTFLANTVSVPGHPNAPVGCL